MAKHSNVEYLKTNVSGRRQYHVDNYLVKVRPVKFPPPVNCPNGNHRI